MPLFLDFKKMSKKSDDGKTAVFQHASGHEVHIKHEKLSPKLREELGKLASGVKSPKMADGGEVPDDSKKKTIGQIINYPGSEPSPKPPAPEPKQNFDDGGEVSPLNSGNFEQTFEQPQAIPDKSTMAPAFNALSDAPQVAAPQASPAQPEAQAPTADGSQAPAPETAPPSENPQQDPMGMQAYSNSLQAGIGEQKAGLAQEAQAEGDLGRQQAADLGQSVNFQQKAQETYQKHVADLTGEYQNFVHDVQNNLIDPKHYQHSMGAGQKVATAIGLILGGIGSGVTGQPNPAMAFLNAQIDRDIEAQGKNLGARENLLSANLRQFGNVRDAADMTRIMQQSIISDQLKKAAATAQDPLAKARALEAAGKIDTDNAAGLSKLAIGRSLMDLAKQQGAEHIPQMIQQFRFMGNEPMAKDLESRYVPHVGLAQVPVPQEVRDRLTGMQTFQQKAQKLYDWAGQHSGSLSPSVIAQGRALAAGLGGDYRAASHGGVYKAGEQEFINNLVDPNPTKFLNSIRVLPKLKATMDSMREDQSALHSSLGLPPVQFANPHEGKTATGPNGAKLIMKGGRWVPAGR